MSKHDSTAHSGNASDTEIRDLVGLARLLPCSKASIGAEYPELGVGVFLCPSKCHACQVRTLALAMVAMTASC